MGQIFICDWCKQPCEYSQTIKIGFKKDRRWGNSWDICFPCQEEIQTRLVSRELSNKQMEPKLTVKDVALQNQGKTASIDFDPRELDDSDIEKYIEDSRPDPNDTCDHSNKSPKIEWQTESRTLSGGKKMDIRIPYNRCRECNKLIKRRHRALNSLSTNVELPDGVTFNDSNHRNGK